MENILDNNLSNKSSKLMKITPYIFCFFIFSFIGWVIEILFCYCIFGEFVERGFLKAPICPIYRYGSIYFDILFGPQQE